MELFKKLSESMAEGTTIALTIAKSESGLAVSVLPGNSLVKDAAKNKFVPICLNGTAEEMDEGFLDTVLQPIAKANGLLSNIKDFEDAQEEAKKASEMEKKAKDEAKKAQEEFNGWMAIAEQNFKENKFKDALTCLDGAHKYATTVAGSASKVDSLREKVKAALGEGSMFGAATEDMSDGKNVKPGKAAKAAPAKAEEPKDDETENEEE